LIEGDVKTFDGRPYRGADLRRRRALSAVFQSWQAARQR
jgi:hypothetical protein